MIDDRVRGEYFDWLLNIVCEHRFANEISYRKLLSYLYNTKFVCRINGDISRVNDGFSLRNRFAESIGFDDSYFSESLRGPASILEVMIALAIRCEETIMDDPRFGDRTGQWFWGMISSLGLSGMIDSQFDKRYVDRVVARFLRREYKPNGEGGLFTVNGFGDLRREEIWTQLCWYLDSIG